MLKLINLLQNSYSPTTVVQNAWLQEIPTFVLHRALISVSTSLESWARTAEHSKDQNTYDREPTSAYANIRQLLQFSSTSVANSCSDECSYSCNWCDISSLQNVATIVAIFRRDVWSLHLSRFLYAASVRDKCSSKL